MKSNQPTNFILKKDILLLVEPSEGDFENFVSSSIFGHFNKTA